MLRKEAAQTWTPVQDPEPPSQGGLCSRREVSTAPLNHANILPIHHWPQPTGGSMEQPREASSFCPQIASDYAVHLFGR